MRLTVCPFSVVVFAASAYVITISRRREKKRKGDNDNNDSSSTLPQCHVVFVLGGPGAGKGTQCQLLTERLTSHSYAHLSTGDLLRAERKKGGPLGDELDKYIKSGQLVPSHVTCRLLQKGMQDVYERTGQTYFLIDGFPRSFENAEAWQDTMQQHVIPFVLNLECPEEILTGRLLKRGETSGRVDDVDIDVIRKRFATHQRETAPIIQHYSTNGKLHTVLADKQIEQVYAEVAALFE